MPHVPGSDHHRSRHGVAKPRVLYGSVRIGSTNRGDQSVELTEDEERPGVKRQALIENTQVLPNVAFRTPEGKTVLVVANDTQSVNAFAIQYDGKLASVKLNPG